MNLISQPVIHCLADAARFMEMNHVESLCWELEDCPLQEVMDYPASECTPLVYVSRQAHLPSGWMNLGNEYLIDTHNYRMKHLCSGSGLHLFLFSEIEVCEEELVY